MTNEKMEELKLGDDVYVEVVDSSILSGSKIDSSGDCGGEIEIILALDWTATAKFKPACPELVKPLAKLFQLHVNKGVMPKQLLDTCT